VRVDVRQTARDFIAHAFDALREEHVVPTPIYHPFVRVGRDYYGDTIAGVPDFRKLEQHLDALYPARFEGSALRRDREFAKTYIYSFLEACIARCGLAAYHGRDTVAAFDPENRFVGETIEELFAVLESPTYEVVCCRFVAHVTTMDAAELSLGPITIVREPDNHVELVRRISGEIPGAHGAFRREPPHAFDRPHSLLITRERTAEPDPWEVARRLSSRLERFLLSARLFGASTCYSVYEVAGTPTLVTRMEPLLTEFRGSHPPVRRTAWVGAETARGLEAIAGLIDRADVRREGMATTSIDVALARFNRSHHSEDPYESLVDLAIALEAVLSDKERGSLTLRLSTRAAGLLATKTDPAPVIFADVKTLYGLRSKVVHGGQITENALRNDLRRISTVPPDSLDLRFGVAIGQAVDRLRDLVRRAILARLCLASGENPEWPLGGNTAVDALLADDSVRARWRASWHERLASFEAPDAASLPRTAAPFLSPHEEDQRPHARPPARDEWC
jgi:hypothetical protein